MSFLAQRQGWPVDLWEWQTPGTKSSFWWNSLRLAQLDASGSTSLDTPCLSAAILPFCDVFSYLFFSWEVFSSSWAYINVSHVPRELKQGSAINHFCCKAPIRRWQMPWSWRQLGWKSVVWISSFAWENLGGENAINVSLLQFDESTKPKGKPPKCSLCVQVLSI